MSKVIRVRKGGLAGLIVAAIVPVFLALSIPLPVAGATGPVDYPANRPALSFDIDLVAHSPSSGVLSTIAARSSNGSALLMAPGNATATDIGNMTSVEAVTLLEGTDAKTAASLLNATSTVKAADVLGKMTPPKSIAVMEEISAEKLTGIVQNMSEALLLERLPGLSAEKLHSINQQALFNALPDVPAEELVAITPPEPAKDAVPPVIIYTGPNDAGYLTLQTIAGEWAVVATPPQIGTILLKTANAAENVTTSIGVLPDRPAGIATPLPDSALVSGYFQINVRNMTADGVPLGYINFKVDKGWLAAQGINEWGIFLNRYDAESGGWVRLPTFRSAVDSSSVYYSAVTSHFSTFAVTGYPALPAASVKVSSLTVLPPAAGNVTVTANVTNLSNATETFPAALWINGRIESSMDMVLQPGETKQASFTTSRSLDANSNVRVDRLSGRFIAGEVAAIPASTPSNATPTPTPDAEQGTNWTLVAAIGVAAALAVVLSRRRLLALSRTLLSRIRPAESAAANEIAVDKSESATAPDEKPVGAGDTGASEPLTKEQWQERMAGLTRQLEDTRQQSELDRQARLEAIRERAQQEAAARLRKMEAERKAQGKPPIPGQKRPGFSIKAPKLNLGLPKKPERPQNSFSVILANAKTAGDITRFQRQLERIEGVRIMLTGGSVADGILFGVTLTKPVELAEAIRGITIVEDVMQDAKTKNILVTIKERSLF